LTPLVQTTERPLRVEAIPQTRLASPDWLIFPPRIHVGVFPLFACD
jgi:hypothetical protein